MIIAIDGTTSSGKSSITKELAKQTKICHINTGLIYRAITKKCLNLNISQNDDDNIKFLLETTNLEYSYDKEKITIKIDGLIQCHKDLTSPEVSNLTPEIAQKDFVREYVRNIQKQLAKINPSVIVEGRDIGSVVFPNADYKFYIDADINTRAERRYKDYLNQGKNITKEQVVKDIINRDNEDQNREHSPLIMTSDSILIDTTNLTIQESVDQIKKIINQQ